MAQAQCDCHTQPHVLCESMYCSEGPKRVHREQYKHGVIFIVGYSLRSIKFLIFLFCFLR